MAGSQQGGQVRTSQEAIPADVTARRSEGTGSGMNSFIHSHIQQIPVQHLPVTDVMKMVEDKEFSKMMSSKKAARGSERQAALAPGSGAWGHGGHGCLATQIPHSL